VLLDLSATAVSPGELQMIGGPARVGPVFEPFQPTGPLLRLIENDFASVHRVRTIQARRALIHASKQNPIPRGPFDAIVSDGPANGWAVMFLAAGRGLPVETRFDLPGSEAPFFWGVEFGLPWVAVLAHLDRSGMGTSPLDNPGGIHPLLIVQGVLIDARPMVVGSTVLNLFGLQQ
jgi:hypothetical protein